MKIYKVKVNGKLYEVELEAVSEQAGSIAAPATNAAPAASAAPSAGDRPVPAPIAGKVIDVKVSVGQKVNKGDVLVIIEAMKLENEVVSPAAGTIKEIKVTKGATVANKDVIVVLG